MRLERCKRAANRPHPTLTGEKHTASQEKAEQTGEEMWLGPQTMLLAEGSTYTEILRVMESGPSGELIEGPKGREQGRSDGNGAGVGAAGATP